MFVPFREMLRSPETKFLVLSTISVITVGTIAYMWLEGWTPIQAMYFCVVTLATVGYGDLHPTTEIGQLFTIGYILIGLGIIAGFITELAKHRQGHGLGAGLVRVEERIAGTGDEDAAEP